MKPGSRGKVTCILLFSLAMDGARERFRIVLVHVTNAEREGERGEEREKSTTTGEHTQTVDGQGRAVDAYVFVSMATQKVRWARR